MADLPCPHERCQHTMRVGSLTPCDLYFCRCTDQEVVRVARQPGVYGGWVPTLVAATPEEREEWPQAKHPPKRSAVSEQESHTADALEKLQHRHEV